MDESRKRKHSDDEDISQPRRKEQNEVNDQEITPPPQEERSEKQAALNRLFGGNRYSNIRLAERVEAMYESDESQEENDDPLMDTVPSHMDPEQLGFLVCAQETLRYLHQRGINSNSPVFSRLRGRFIKGLQQMGFD